MVGRKPGLSWVAAGACVGHEEAALNLRTPELTVNKRYFVDNPALRALRPPIEEQVPCSHSSALSL